MFVPHDVLTNEDWSAGLTYPYWPQAARDLICECHRPHLRRRILATNPLRPLPLGLPVLVVLPLLKMGGLRAYSAFSFSAATCNSSFSHFWFARRSHSGDDWSQYSLTVFSNHWQIVKDYIVDRSAFRRRNSRR